MGCTGSSSISNGDMMRISADPTTAPLVGSLIDGYQESSRVTLPLSFKVCPRPCIISEIADGTVDAAIILHPPTENVFVTPIGFEQIVFIVHPENPLENISSIDAQRVLSGAISSWSEISIIEAPAEVIVSPAGTSTRVALETYLPDMFAFSSSARLASDPEEIVRLVATTPGAIGGVPYSHVTTDVRVLALDGNHPKQYKETYPIIVPVSFVTHVEPEGDIRAYLDWILGDDGQATVKRFAQGVRD